MTVKNRSRGKEKVYTHTVIMSNDGRKVRGVVLDSAATANGRKITLCKDCGKDIMNSKRFVCWGSVLSLYNGVCNRCGRRITSSNQRMEKELKSKIKKFKKKNTKIKEEIELWGQIEELFMIGGEGDKSEPSFTFDDEWARKAIVLLTKCT